MYTEFYNFKEKPFSLLPDPGFLFMSSKHRQALSMLEYGILNKAGFTVVTGEIGAGKTTLVRQLLEQMDEDITVGLVSNTHASFGEMLQWVLLAFDLEYRNKEKVEMFHLLSDFLIEEYAKGQRTVLIIDEAQNMSIEGLEELRMLSNINANKDQLIQLILIGQPNLKTLLRVPELVQFAQRIAVEYHLDRLGLQETWKYIKHRIAVAGGDPNLFNSSACAAIHYYTQGTPRLINVICDTALVCGFGDGVNVIKAELIHEIVKDRKVSGILPLEEEPENKDVVKNISDAKKKFTDHK